MSGTATAPAQPSGTAAQQILELQAAGRILRAYLARHPNPQVPCGTGLPLGGSGPDILNQGAAAILANAGLERDLVATVECLSRAAFPATVETIRVTRDFMATGPAATPGARRTRRCLRVGVGGVVVLLVVAMLLSILLLMGLDDGRRTVGQLDALRLELATAYGDLAKLNLKTDWVVVQGKGGKPVALEAPAAAGDAPAAPDAPVFVPYCDPPTLDEDTKGEDKEALASYPTNAQWRRARTQQAEQSCSHLAQLKLREELVFTRLAAWNCQMLFFNPFDLLSATRPKQDAASGKPVPAYCAWPPVELHKTLSLKDWSRTELRTIASMAMISGYILPVLLGGIGGCVYVLRRIADRVATHTLAMNDGKHGLMRVMLAATLGGLLGLVFGTDVPVHLGGFSLSLAAWAFFLGYSLEAVLRQLDAAIGAIISKLQPQAPPPKAPPGGQPP
ncbi:hypothetical protein E2C06_13880 [Dankookia rubra]|uniref:Uncharacterized protein n=1 Tax=Dankookia rubra TaxID=1442381 RepID=A0A4R5QFN7_9PROT|nr:hypothetical protein [Dankookia rubra]TDH62050.1 hypothetical protein E2C06_13880 [Dankookia rubra]